MSVVPEGLVPARFLTLMAHLVVIILAFSSRDANIKACLADVYTKSEYDDKESSILTGYVFTIIFLVVEFAGFFSGVTMFNKAVAIFSIAAHSSAGMALSFYLIDTWDCELFWPVFFTCSLLPAITEVVVVVFTLRCKR